MLNVLEIIEKLKDVLSADGKKGKIYDKDLADVLELSQANFATMKNRSKIPFSNILNFCALKKISINWLLYNQNPSSLLDNTNRYWIRYYKEINLSAGGGAFEANEDKEDLEIPKYFLSSLGGQRNIKNIEAMNVSGDSMEPTISNGSIIFIDTSKNDLNKDGIYAFVSSNELFVKRMQKRVDGKIDIVSDNKDYPKQIVNGLDIKIFGKVLGAFGCIY